MVTTSRPTEAPRAALVALALAAAVIVAIYGWSAAVMGTSETPAAPPPGGVGDPIPAFRLPAADGRTIGPADFSGRVVLYEFWATWCAPCHVQVEILKKLYPAATSRGVVFVAIAAGEPESVVREHLAKAPYPWPVVFDPEDSVGASLDVLGLPTLIVTGPDGSIVWRNTGLVDAGTLEQVFARAAKPPAG